MTNKNWISENTLEFNVVKYDSTKAEIWNKFILESSNGTLFHQVDFLDYHPKDKFEFHHLMFYSKENDTELVAVLPAIKSGRQLTSPGGASFGAFVFSKTNLGITEGVLRAFLKYVTENHFTSVQITPPPIFYSSDLSQNIDYLLFYYGAVIEKNLVTNALHLDLLAPGNRNEILSEMHLRCVKKSLKEGVTCRISDSLEDYQSFYAMLVANKKKFNQPPTHSLEEIIWIKNRFPNRVFLFMAYNKSNQPIGSIWALKCNNNCLLAFYINHYYEFRDLRAVNRLYQELIDFAVEEKYSWIDLGVSMDTSKPNPMEPSRSLIYFKECIGTRGFLRTTYRISL